MDKLTSGQLIVKGEDIAKYDKFKLTEYRRHQIGFVFQFYNLMPNLTALENVELAVETSNNALNPEAVLKEVGLGDCLKKFPSQLSGGQQQRVSIARAIAKNTDLILCDEPTGALDYATGKEILELLQKQAHQEGKTVIIVTHNSALAEMADHLIRVKNGKIVLDQYNSAPTPVEQIEW
jgi:putative ABC transport system ATP-binding protein